MNTKHNSNKVIASDFMPKDEVSQAILLKRSKLLGIMPDTDAKHQNSLINYIQFKLGKNELYGIPYEKTKEVMNNFHLTPVPNLPPYIAGIINMRGALIAVLDLKILLGISDTSTPEYSQIIIVNKDKIVVGILVDNIIGNDTYDPVLLDLPVSSQTVMSEFILGIHEGTTAIINVESILSNSNLHIDFVS